MPVAPQLETIIMRALAKRREDRFQTAQEMALALERYAFAAEGFSPLQLATYLKGLFDVEFAQWKKTVSSALDIEAKPGAILAAQSGTQFPVIQKPDLPTRGPTVALRKNTGSSSQNRPGIPTTDGGGVREPTTDLRTDAPSRRDRLWVYGGVTALGMVVLAGVFLLGRPRAPLPSTLAPPAAPARWQSSPPPPTISPLAPPVPTPPPPVAEKAPVPEVAPALEKPPERPTEKAPEKATVTKVSSPSESSHGRGERRSKGHGGKRSGAQAPVVPTDHRPNPFD
jgi:serine/threonine-protein kinase